jgi:hypothetical protein
MSSAEIQGTRCTVDMHDEWITALKCWATGNGSVLGLWLSAAEQKERRAKAATSPYY